uniref:Uncharacterized protein n=1 Tax=Echinococcus canadensis TaxID=519352 RepID=A0A915EWB7_9CEST
MTFPPKYCSPHSPFRCCRRLCEFQKEASSTAWRENATEDALGGTAPRECKQTSYFIEICRKSCKFFSFYRMRWNFPLCNLTTAAKFFRGLSAQPLIESIRPA